MRSVPILNFRFALAASVLLGAVAGVLTLPGAASPQSTRESVQSTGEAAQRAVEDARRAVEAAQSALESPQNAREADNGPAPSESPVPEPKASPASRDLDFLLYGGKFMDSTYRRILFQGDTNYLPSYIWVAGVNYKLGQLLGPITIETEGQIGRHTGIQDNWEINALVIARMEWVWDNKFSFSVAQGDGFSLASKKPILEVKDNPSTNVFLQYLLTEIVFGFPSVSWHPRFLIRVHHRSGSFGIHCSGTCGSNFITYGLKGAF